MLDSKWSPRARWLGDPKPIAREINAQKARHDEKQVDIMDLLGLKRQALARRMRGETAWARWEIDKLAAHWSIAREDLTGEDP